MATVFRCCKDHLCVSVADTLALSQYDTLQKSARNFKTALHSHCNIGSLCLDDLVNQAVFACLVGAAQAEKPPGQMQQS
eukprot:2612607-Amphidinium_carterae.2